MRSPWNPATLAGRNRLIFLRDWLKQRYRGSSEANGSRSAQSLEQKSKLKRQKVWLVKVLTWPTLLTYAL